MESGYKCANPTCRNTIALQMHHMVWVRDGGDNDPANLVALCAYCHDMHTRGNIPADAIGGWKLMLQSLNQALDRDALDLLLFLARPPTVGSWRFRVSGDGILRLARLINSGLVDPGFRQGSAGSPASGDALGIYEPQLTDRGVRLVQSYRQGDVAGFSHALIAEAGFDSQ